MRARWSPSSRAQRDPRQRRREMKKARREAVHARQNGYKALHGCYAVFAMSTLRRSTRGRRAKDVSAISIRSAVTRSR